MFILKYECYIVVFIYFQMQISLIQHGVIGVHGAIVALLAVKEERGSEIGFVRYPKEKIVI